MEFLYCVDSKADEPIMLINSWIGWDKEMGYGIMGDRFLRELLELDAMDKKRIQVWINSPGGSVQDGYDIYQAMIATKTKVDTYCYGIAASISGVLFQAGRNRIMYKHARLMYHNAYGVDNDKAIQSINSSIAQIIADRAKKELSEIEMIMAQTTWITAVDAETYGFSDKTIDSGAMNINSNRLETNKVEVYNLVKEYNEIYDSILKPKKENNMNELVKINNKLELNPDAAIESTVAAIEKIINKATAAEAECDKVKNEFGKKEEELSKAKAELENAEKSYNALKAEFEKMKNAMEEEKKAAEAKAKEELEAKAKAEVETLVKDGKIKNDAKIIEELQTKFVSDFACMKNIFDSMPLNKVANKIVYNGNERGTNYKGSLIAETMVKLSI